MATAPKLRRGTSQRTDKYPEILRLKRDGKLAVNYKFDRIVRGIVGADYALYTSTINARQGAPGGNRTEQIKVVSDDATFTVNLPEAL